MCGDILSQLQTSHLIGIKADVEILELVANWMERNNTFIKLLDQWWIYREKIQPIPLPIPTK